MKGLSLFFITLLVTFCPTGAHAQVRDQRDTGFCWAYTIANHLEETATLGKKNLSLSAEYLAYHKLAENLYEELPRFAPLALSTLSKDLMLSNAIELIRLTRTKTLLDQEQGNSLERGFDLLEEVGIVPDEIFIQNQPSMIVYRPSIDTLLEDFAKKNLLDFEKLSYLIENPSYFKQALFMALGAAPILSDTTFEYDGVVYNPQTFLKSFFKTDFNKIESLSVYKPSILPAAIRTIQKLLKRNHSVPISFPVLAYLQNQKETGLWSPTQCPKGHCGPSTGAHAALIVGIQKEGFIIENSWGFRGLGRNAQPAKYLDSGFDLLTFDYLKQAIEAAPDLVSFVAMPDKKISLEKLFYQNAY